MSARHPEVVWAQRSDKVFLTVELPDAKDPKVDVTEDGHFSFSATVGAENVPYEVDVDLYDKVLKEECKFVVGLRHTFCVLIKAEKAWWPRLLKPAGKAPPFLKADWNRWVDDEEEEKEADTGMGSFDMNSMNDFSKFGLGGAGGAGGMGGLEGMGGMGGMGGMDFGGAGGEAEDEDDDEELPELEK